MCQQLLWNFDVNIKVRQIFCDSRKTGDEPWLINNVYNKLNIQQLLNYFDCL